MTDYASKKAGDYLQGRNQNLQSILAKVKQLQLLNEHFGQYVNPDMAQFCHVANLVNGKLVIIAANGSIATQLRFEAMDLLRKFKADPVLKAVRQIESKVRPSMSPAIRARKPQKMEPLSAQTAELINDIAETLDDPRLKAALKRIAGYRK